MSFGLLRISLSLYSVSNTLYVCSYSLSVYFIIVVTTVVAPEIIIPPDDTTVINGSETVLNCTVVGDPLPSISWSVSGVDISLLISNGLMIPFDEQGKINDMIVDNTILNHTTMHSSLQLNETTSFIAGYYTCTASNILGDINRTASLTVHGMYTSNS